MSKTVLVIPTDSCNIFLPNLKDFKNTLPSILYQFMSCSGAHLGFLIEKNKTLC
jgi:hypothetical protein